LDLVGSNPTHEVLALSSEPGVQVSGTVSAEVLERYYREAAVAIVPLRFGAGVKLKVLEAMSRGVPVVTTTVGAQGLPGVERCISVVDDVEGVLSAVVALIGDRELAARRIAAAQAYVRQHYSGSHMRQALTRAMASA
jgi:O-antigen biosynthesis protein